MRGSEPMPWRTVSMSAPSRVGEVGELVHERDARREHRVGRVLGELGRAHVHHQQALVVALERRVERAQRARSRARRRRRSTTRSGRMKSSTAAPSFRNSGLDTTANGDRARRAPRAPRRSPRARGRRCRPARSTCRRRSCSSFMRRPMLRAAASTYCMSAEPSSSGRRADRDELQRAVRHRCVDVGGEAQAPGGDVALDHRLEPRLVDRHAARVAGSRSCARRRRGTARRCRPRRGRCR